MQTEIQTADLVEPKESEIRSQLANILEDAEFKRSPKISQFLKYVVEQVLSGNQRYLKAHSIAISVFNKDESFDPQADPVVRVNAVRLRRMLRQYYSTEGVNNDVTIEIIKGSYVPRFYYTNKSDEAVKHLTNISNEGSFPSIAVVNFKYLSSNSANSYIADGITQEVVNQLCQFKEITVISRSFTGLNDSQLLNTQRLHEIIDVRYLLSGSVRIDNETIRINVELDDTTAHKIIWTHEYTTALNVKNIISIENEIATHVAVTVAQPYGVIIRKELANLGRVPTEHLDTYQLYLLFYQWALTLSASDHLKARDALEQVVKIDPTFSDAWAALAMIYNTEYQLSCNQIKRDKDVRDLAFETAQRAIKTDPDNARAHYALVFSNMTKFGTRACLDEAEKIYQLYPQHALYIAVYGKRLAVCGEWEYGLSLIKHAMVINPSHPDFYHLPFILDYYRRDLYKEAINEARKVNMPDYFWANLILAALYAEMGDKHRVQKNIERVNDLYPDFVQKARFEFEKWDVQRELKEKLICGLNKAGLKIV